MILTKKVLTLQHILKLPIFASYIINDDPKRAT